MDPFDILDPEELERIKPELETWTGYIPLKLLGLVDRTEYFNRWTREASRKYKQTRQNIGSDADSLNEYLINDILEWVEEYPQFERIILWDKIR